MPLRLPTPGAVDGEATHVMGSFLRDVMKANADTRNFRVFGPDETRPTGCTHVFEVTDRTWDAQTIPDDDHLAPDGRVMEILSEHTCQGWLEGYLLTGRHGLFICYEAFIHIVDSMFNQHAKWLKTCRAIPWRRPIASLNYLLTSHVWRQDHNGFSHQDPGFIDHVVNKKADIVRVYLPPDANTLLWVTDHCLRSWDRINVIVAGKQPEPQWLDMEAAIKHCTAGHRHLGMGQQRSRARSPTWSWPAPATCRRWKRWPRSICCAGMLPDLRVRVVNVVDLMTLQPHEQHPHGLTEPRVRRDVHHRQAGDLRLSRLSLADPPADLQAHQPRQFPCARLHGGRHHDHAVRHGRCCNRLDRFHLAADVSTACLGWAAEPPM